MITAEFEYEYHDTLEELFSLLSANPDDTKLLAGGMTIVPMMNLGLVAPARIVSLRKIAQLTDIHETDNAIVLGAMTRHHMVASDRRVHAFAPALATAARLIGDVQVRNRGTLGGSLAHADPAANYLPPILLLDSVLNLASPSRRRQVRASDFFSDAMTTLLAPDELIISVEIKKRPARVGYGFRKFARVKGNFPIVCAAAWWDNELALGKLVVGGVTSKPAILELTPDNRSMPETAPEVIRAAIVDPLEDLNGDAEYKREIAVVMGGRALSDALLNAERKRIP